jgi:hypothetical protein
VSASLSPSSLDGAVEIAKMVTVVVAAAAWSMLDFDIVGVAAVEERNPLLVVETGGNVEAAELEIIVDVEFDATNTVSKGGLTELLEYTTLSFNAVPFHITLQGLVLKLLGTRSHIRRSFFPRTGKALGSVALPCITTE